MRIGRYAWTQKKTIDEAGNKTFFGTPRRLFSVKEPCGSQDILHQIITRRKLLLESLSISSFQRTHDPLEGWRCIATSICTKIHWKCLLLTLFSCRIELIIFICMNQTIWFFVYTKQNWSAIQKLVQTTLPLTFSLSAAGSFFYVFECGYLNFSI